MGFKRWLDDQTEKLFNGGKTLRESGKDNIWRALPLSDRVRICDYCRVSQVASWGDYTEDEQELIRWNISEQIKRDIDLLEGLSK